jgi:hypothetical protein
MESSEEPSPTDNPAHSPAPDDMSEEVRQHNKTQQITGASAADEAAIISAASGIGTIQNNRTNIK